MNTTNAFSRFMAIIAVILAVLALNPIGVVRGISSTPVYVLGATGPLDPLVINLQTLTSSVVILPSVSGISSLGAGSILYVDGGWLSNTAALDPTVLSTIANSAIQGLPTVVVRGNPSIL